MPNREYLPLLFAILMGLLCFTAPTVASAIEATAHSCSAADITAAVDSVIAAGGGTVNLPACQADNTWESSDRIDINTDLPLNIRGAGRDATIIGYKDGHRPTGGVAMFINGSGLKELSGFTLRGHKTDDGIQTGIRVYSMSMQNLRIHHIRLQQFENTALYICQSENSPIVIDHCEFGDQYNGMYGIRVTGSNRQSDYVMPAFFGVDNPNAVFIEDNTFNDTYHPVAAFGASNIVFRHNMVRDVTSWIDGHGPCYGLGCSVGSIQPRSGTYIYEIYDNDIDTGNYYACFGLRGGTGIVTDNRMRGCNSYAIRFRIEGCSMGTDCSAAAGCPHSTDDTSKCYQAPNQYWVWGNDYMGGDITAGDIEISDQGTGCIRENHEFYLRAPNSGDPVTSYTKYPYPHPLVEGNTQAPRAPTNLKVVSPPSN